MLIMQYKRACRQASLDQKSKICDFTMYPPFSLRYSHKNHSISSNYDIF